MWGKGLMRASLPKIPIPTFNLSWHFSIYVILIYTPTQMHAQAHMHTCTHTLSIRGHQSLYFCTLSCNYLAPYTDRHTYEHTDISEHMSGLSLYSVAQEQNKKYFIYETSIYAEDRKLEISLGYIERPRQCLLPPVWIHFYLSVKAVSLGERQRQCLLSPFWIHFYLSVKATLVFLCYKLEE